MRAMVLHGVHDLRQEAEPLRLEEVPEPEPGPGEIRIRIAACGVCHTELDEIEGRTPPPRYPIVPGHQVVGRVEKLGPGAVGFRKGDRVGVAWIHSACGSCDLCSSGRENLCPGFRATGRDVDGGYAEAMVVRDDFAVPLPGGLPDLPTAPLLGAGAIGYRSLRLTGLENGRPLGLTGFGGSAHLVLESFRAG